MQKNAYTHHYTRSGTQKQMLSRHVPLLGRTADWVDEGCRKVQERALEGLCQAAPGQWTGQGVARARLSATGEEKKSSSIAASLLGIPAQLTDMQISLIISSSKINYILQWLQYVVSGKITFNIFKLIDVSLEKT